LFQLEEAVCARESFCACSSDTHERPVLSTVQVVFGGFFFLKVRDGVINHICWSHSRRKLYGEMPLRVDAVLSHFGRFRLNIRKISLLKELWSFGTDCPGEWWSHHPWRCS